MLNDGSLPLFFAGVGVLCEGCEWRQPCGAAETDFACSPAWGSERYGGEYALHPRAPLTKEYLTAVRGPEFDGINAERIICPPLPGYLPQLRLRSSLSGFLRERVYAIRAKDVVGARAHILRASEVRDLVGLHAEQKLIVLLFDDDDVLERFWRPSEGARLAQELAAAGYDLVVAPSYSAWEPRPRPEFLYSAKRSLAVFSVLQNLGAPALVRVAWVIPHDARRMGAWVRANPAVEIVGLDLQTYGRSAVSWRRQMEGLKLFDGVTKRRLRYLVNGPSTESACADVFEAVPARRVCLTNSTAAAPPPDPPPNQMTLVRSDRTGPTFEGRCAAQRAVVRRGARLAMARRTKGRTAEFC